MPSILTVDDEAGIRAFLSDTLTAESHLVSEAADGEAALRALEDRPFDLMLLDLRMPGSLDGMAVLRQARARWPEMQVIVLTAYGTVGNAVEAMRLGAFDFLEKPLESPDAVRSIVRRAMNWRGRTPRHRTDEEPAPVAGAPARRRPLLARVRHLLHELRRRRVYHAAATYAAICVATLEIGQVVLPVLPVPGWTYTALAALSFVGLPVVLVFGWVYDVSLTRTANRASTAAPETAWQR